MAVLVNANESLMAVSVNANDTARYFGGFICDYIFNPRIKVERLLRECMRFVKKKDWVREK